MTAARTSPVQYPNDRNNSDEANWLGALTSQEQTPRRRWRGSVAEFGDDGAGHAAPSVTPPPFMCIEA